MTPTTSEELAKSLHPWNFEDSFTKHVCRTAKENNLIIVSAIGNDTITFTGALTDEFYLVKGGNIFMAKETVPAIYEDGRILHKEYVEYVPYKKQGVNNDRKKIEIFWEEYKLFTWKFLTLIPHHTFEIKKNNKNFCKGIVFSLNDI